MAAADAADAIQAARRPDGGLPRTLEPGAPDGELSDYAHTAEGLLDLYEATLQARWLTAAADLARQLLARFYDPATGLLYHAGIGATGLALRQPDLVDGAEPSGTGRALEVLRRLAAYGADVAPHARLVAARAAAAGHCAEEPGRHVSLAALAARVDAGGAEVILSAAALDAPGVTALTAAYNSAWRPTDVLGAVTAADVEALVGFAAFRARAPRDGAARAFVCRDHACGLPTGDPAELLRQLNEAPS
jgi:hypothetical protein